MWILLSRLYKSPAFVVLRVPVQDLPRLGHLFRVDHDSLELPARYRDEVRYERYLGHLPHPPQDRLDLGCMPMARRPIGDRALVHADEVRLRARPRPGPAHPRERVYRYGAYALHPLHDRRQRQNGRRRIASRVGYESPQRGPEDLGQPVVRLREKLGGEMLSVPLAV